jgi:riboflavin-specific deaminase-like protein
MLTYGCTMDRPLITVSYAQSLDGRTATIAGESQWISGDETLNLAHQLRGTNDVILVGIGTVLTDDPLLSCRIPDYRSPVRVVLDSRLRLPLKSMIARTAGKHTTIVFVSADHLDQAAPGKLHSLRTCGVEIVPVGTAPDGHIDIREVSGELFRRGYRSIFVEGGSAVTTSFFRAGLVDVLVAVIAPVLLGDGIPSVGDLGVRHLADAHRLKPFRLRQLGNDIVWELRKDDEG